MRRKERTPADLPTPNRLELLKRTVVFRGLDEPQLEILAQLGRWVFLAAGSTLCREGDAGTEMYVIGVGMVSLHKDVADGSRFIAQREVGDVVGEMALLDNRPRSATAICDSDCMLLAIRKAEFTARVRKHPEIAMGIIANLLERLREADERAVTSMTADVAARLARFLLDEASLKNGVAGIRPKPADRKIADRIGCSRETVSRKLTEFQLKGVIQRQRSELVILDENELTEISDG